MEVEHGLTTYRQRTWVVTPRNVVALAPLGLAAAWLLSDVVHGSPSIWTMIFSGIMGAVGVVGLLFVFTPVELVADRQGLSWRQFAYKRTIPWAQVEEIGVAIVKGFEGYDNRTVRLLTNSVPPPRSPKIGVNLKMGDRNSSTVGYKRGFTGYELNWTNVFTASTSEIVSDLDARLKQSRQADGS